MRESYLQKKLIAALKERSIYHVKIITAGTAGHPDYIACLPGGRFLGVECKAENGIQSPLQKFRESEIKKNGGEYFLLHPNGLKKLLTIISA